MFDFFKKSISGEDLLKGFTDVHCHILPGVDDGVQHMERTLQILDYYERNGVQRVFFTPHVMEEFYKNTREYLIERFKEVKAHYKGNLQLSLGAEYMMDINFYKLFDQKEDFLCASPNLLLIETSTTQAPMDLREIIYQLQRRGYTLMLAHPERYTYMEEEDYKKMQELGVKLQMNLLSIAGSYGETAQKKSQMLCKKGMYTYVGTDLHSLSYHHHVMEKKKYTSNEIKEIARLMQNNSQLPQSSLE